MTIVKTTQELRDDEIARLALEKAAKAVEGRAGNQVYKRAWIIAAEVIRNLKPF